MMLLITTHYMNRMKKRALRHTLSHKIRHFYADLGKGNRDQELRFLTKKNKANRRYQLHGNDSFISKNMRIQGETTIPLVR